MPTLGKKSRLPTSPRVLLPARLPVWVSQQQKTAAVTVELLQVDTSPAPFPAPLQPPTAHSLSPPGHVQGDPDLIMKSVITSAQ